jgi:hypothetical protein
MMVVKRDDAALSPERDSTPLLVMCRSSGYAVPQMARRRADDEVERS